MKRLIIALALTALIIVTLSGVALAGKNGPAGKGNSNVGHLYLYEKDNEWNIVDGGAWGKFNYSLSGTGEDTMVSGVFNGKGLEPGVCYALITTGSTK